MILTTIIVLILMIIMAVLQDVPLFHAILMMIICVGIVLLIVAGAVYLPF